jgi:hypothetical protein
MKVKPASVHFLAKAGFSLNWSESVCIRPKNSVSVQSHNQDVCLDILALWQSVLSGLHPGMRKGRPDSQRTVSSRHAVIEHLGR